MPAEQISGCAVSQQGKQCAHSQSPQASCCKAGPLGLQTGINWHKGGKLISVLPATCQVPVFSPEPHVPSRWDYCRCFADEELRPKGSRLLSERHDRARTKAGPGGLQGLMPVCYPERRCWARPAIPRDPQEPGFRDRIRTTKSKPQNAEAQAHSPEAGQTTSAQYGTKDRSERQPPSTSRTSPWPAQPAGSLHPRGLEELEASSH